jgi:hypothetical protein
MKGNTALLALLIGSIGLTGCGPAEQSPNAATVPPSSPPVVQQPSETQEQQKQVALAARDALFQELLGRLMDAMASGGPASAIEVCQQQAPQIASKVGEEFDVAIGRTSHRLRNPQNVPPDWARPLVDQRTSEPQLVSLDEGTLGVFLPIHLKPQCLMCHGPEEQILPDVRDALARAYPQDQATGFQDGDLRGWFWITVPAGAALPSGVESAVPSADTNTSQES